MLFILNFAKVNVDKSMFVRCIPTYIELQKYTVYEMILNGDFVCHISQFTYRTYTTYRIVNGFAISYTQAVIFRLKCSCFQIHEITNV